eukprot:3062990-Rhodomonas_salina.2
MRKGSEERLRGALSVRAGHACAHATHVFGHACARKYGCASTRTGVRAAYRARCALARSTLTQAPDLSSSYASVRRRRIAQSAKKSLLVRVSAVHKAHRTRLGSRVHCK